MIDVNVIKEIGKTTLIEAVWEGHVLRRIIPTDKVSDGAVLNEDFESGIEYGLPFMELVHKSPPPDIATRIEDALHGAGIWTLEDLKSNARIAGGALQAAYGIEVGAIIASGEAYLKQAQDEVKLPAARSTKTKKE